MSNNEPYVERTVTEGPATVRREEIRTVEPRPSSSAGWWLAALVAIVAIVGVFFAFNSGMSTQNDLMAAKESGRAEAMLDTASAQAQQAAADASQASANAAASMGDATRSAADSAASAADRASEATQQAAASATDAAQDVTAQEPQQ